MHMCVSVYSKTAFVKWGVSKERPSASGRAFSLQPSPSPPWPQSIFLQSTAMRASSRPDMNQATEGHAAGLRQRPPPHPTASPRQGFLSLGTVDIWSWMMLWFGSDKGYCPMHCRVFNSIPNLYLLDARNTPSSQLWQPKMSQSVAKRPLEIKSPPVENTCSLPS